nr:ABC transporter ATP-binding protein [Desulfurispira natronophila]
MQIANVRHSYDTLEVLKGVDLEVHRGEVACLLGPSGCGKTTLLRLIAGLEQLQSGAIRIADTIVADARGSVPPEKRNTGFLFQDFALFPHLRVKDNVSFGLIHQKPEQRKEKAQAALRRVGMLEYADAYPHQLSGGQQQRVALARALAPEPSIILLDEPFSSLDTRLRSQVRDETLHVLKNSGVATVMVTHDPEEAMFMGDKIALMNRGVIVQVDDPVQLYYHPVNAFVATFFSDVNRMEAVARNGKVDTPFGTLEAPDIADETTVDVLFRPDALQLALPQGEDGGVSAEVTASRMLVGSTLVHLRLEYCGPSCPMHVHARIPGRFPHPDGSRVSVTLNPDQVFIFPMESGDLSEYTPQHCLKATDQTVYC